MAGTRATTGRLIAVDGTRGKDTAAAAEALAAALTQRGVDCAISRFDASGLFAELAASTRSDRTLSIRTLMLVYAADLAFRLRWEITPTLQSGLVVIAAPYVDTAVALGAGRDAVVWMVLKGSTKVVLIGLAIGLILALAAGRAVESFLGETSAADPVALLTAPLVMIACAIVASWLPARRAARIDPMRALREE